MIAASLIVFGSLMYYATLGIPGIPYGKGVGRLIGWRSLSERLATLASTMEKERGSPPLIIGMDKHYTAAELAFYLRRSADQHDTTPLTVSGRSLFGLDSLMFHYWAPREDLSGKDALLISRTAGDLSFPEVLSAFDHLGPVEEFRAHNHGKPAGRYFLRAAFGYNRSHPPFSDAFLKSE